MMLGCDRHRVAPGATEGAVPIISPLLCDPPPKSCTVRGAALLLL